MRRVKISVDSGAYPQELQSLFDGATIYDSSSSPEARVIYIEKDGGYYLKSAAGGALLNEAKMTAYFHEKGLSTEVLSYVFGERDYLLTRRVVGEDATNKEYLSDPKRLCDLMAESLRRLHETDFSDCPIDIRNETYLETIKENYSRGIYDPAFMQERFRGFDRDRAYDFVMNNRTALSGRVLLHGDYCLPNIMLDNWRLSAFIDLGNAGVGDRHIDLFWGAWTLNFNLGTDEYRARFFDAYGRDLVDLDKIDYVSLAESFG